MTTVYRWFNHATASATWLGLRFQSSWSLGYLDLQLFPVPEKVFTLWWTNILPWKDPPFLMGKSTISMAIFNCYVSSPEGRLSHGFQNIFSKFAFGLTRFNMPELRLPGRIFCVCFSTHPHSTTLDFSISRSTNKKASSPWPTRIKASHGLAWSALPSALWCRGPDVEMGRAAQGHRVWPWGSPLTSAQAYETYETATKIGRPFVFCRGWSWFTLFTFYWCRNNQKYGARPWHVQTI